NSSIARAAAIQKAPVSETIRSPKRLLWRKSASAARLGVEIRKFEARSRALWRGNRGGVMRWRAESRAEETIMPITEQKYIWSNGELVPWADAKVHVLTHALHYATAVFEGMRAYETKHKG